MGIILPRQKYVSQNGKKSQGMFLFASCRFIVDSLLTLNSKTEYHFITIITFGINGEKRENYHR